MEQVEENVSTEKFLGRRDVLTRVGFSNSTLWRGIKAGEFPRPIKISSRRVGWLESEIHDWVQNRITQSRNQK